MRPACRIPYGATDELAYRLFPNSLGRFRAAGLVPKMIWVNFKIPSSSSFPFRQGWKGRRYPGLAGIPRCVVRNTFNPAWLLYTYPPGYHHRDPYTVSPCMSKRVEVEFCIDYFWNLTHRPYRLPGCVSFKSMSSGIWINQVWLFITLKSIFIK